jgi:glycosyltransferase involved in cell wall biosynthesis
VSDTEVRALREEIGLPENAPVVGIVARVNREKGYEELFEAAAIVARDVPGVCFLVIGPVEHEKADALDPEELAVRHGVADRLYFLGLRDDMPVLYRLMDVLAHPSHREGWPRAPMEAAAMGVPSVVTDIRGCRQVVVDGTTGIMVPVRDSAALAAALTVLLNDPERRWAMGRAARSHALEAFDEAGVVRRTLEVYREFAPAPAA